MSALLSPLVPTTQAAKLDLLPVGVYGVKHRVLSDSNQATDCQHTLHCILPGLSVTVTLEGTTTGCLPIRDSLGGLASATSALHCTRKALRAGICLRPAQLCRDSAPTLAQLLKDT